MKGWRIVLSVALALGVQAVALAQAGPDFSGTWRFNQEKSSQGIAGNSPDLPFPSQLVVKQSADELYVESRSVRQATLTATFRLDGNTVTLETPRGITETGTAMLEGATMVVATRRSYPSPAGEIVAEFEETWSLDGTVLTIEKTRTQDGESVTETAVYDRS